MELSEYLKRAPVGKSPHLVKPMMATLIDEAFTDDAFIFEIKWDGYRTVAEISNGEVEIYSRNQISFNQAFPHLVEALKFVEGEVVLDGEAVALDNLGLPSFELIQNYRRNKEGTIVYYVFDILYINGRDLTGLKLLERKKILASILPKDSFYIRESEFIPRVGEEFFVAAKRQNLEGIVAKRLDSVYEIGKRSRDWLKIKAHQEQEVVIGGFTEPRGGRQGFGSLILGVYEDGNLVHIGNAGGGFKEKELVEMRRRLEKIEIKRSPFSDFSANGEHHWVKPVLVGEVKFAEWTKDGAMRQPIFLGLRDDKKPEDVRKEIPKEAEDVA